MIYIISILYSVFLYMFIDTLLATPLYWGMVISGTTLLITSTVYYLYNVFIKKDKGINNIKIFIRKELTSFLIMLTVLLVFVLQLGRKITDWEVVLSQFLLIGNTFMVAKAYSFANKKNIFYLLSYMIPALFLLICYKNAGYPGINKEQILNIFENAGRIRNSFSFSHPNTAGNLAVGTIMISIVYIANIIKSKDHISLKILKPIMLILLDIPLIAVLINTASRNSILALLVFISSSIYFVLTNIKILPKVVKVILKALIIIFVTLNIYNYVNTNYDKLLKDSNREGNFTINLPILDTKEKKLFGLGLAYVGDFADKELIPGIKTTYVDNFYLYMYLCTGFVGLFFFLAAYLIIGIKLYINMYKNKSLESNIIPALFISHMLLGIGETCVLYFTFTTGFLLTVIYLITNDELYLKLDMENNNK